MAKRRRKRRTGSKTVWTPEAEVSLAYVHGLSSLVGFTFRSLTGADFGIDQAIESTSLSSAGKRSQVGVVGLQIKSTRKVLGGGLRSLHGANSNQVKYWLDLGRPFVFCLVKVKKVKMGYRVEGAKWLNLWELKHQGLLEGSSHRLTRTFRLLMKHPSNPVIETGGVHDLDKWISKWKKWILNSLGGPEVRDLNRTLVYIDQILEAGKAQFASLSLKKTHLDFGRWTSPRVQFDLLLSYAKSLRRVKSSKELKKTLVRLDRIAAKEGIGRKQKRGRVLVYEKGFDELLSAIRSPGTMRARDLQAARKCFRASTVRKPTGFGEKRETLIGQASELLASSMQCYFSSCSKGKSHVEGGVKPLTETLRWWLRKRTKTEAGQEDFYRRKYNGQLSLARWYLSHGKKWLGLAAELLDEIEKDLQRLRGHHALHSLAHFHIVRAWSFLVADDIENASCQLTRHRLVFKACLPDEELLSYHNLFSEGLRVRALDS